MLQRNGPRDNERAKDRGEKRGRIRLELPRTVPELAERYPRLLARVAAVGRLSSIDEAAVILRDAIAVTTDQSAEVLTVLHILVQRIVTEDDIAEFPGFIRHFQFGDDATIGDNTDFGSAQVAQCVAFDRAAVGQLSEGGFGDGTGRFGHVGAGYKAGCGQSSRN